jgi:predicted secreted protein
MPRSLIFGILGAIAAAAAVIVLYAYLPTRFWSAFGSWIAVYFVVWWLVFIATLPVGVQSQAEAGNVVPGTEPGAPTTPAIGWKAVLTTIIAAALTVVLYFLLPLLALY